MTSAIAPFGELPDGAPVQAVDIAAGDLSVSVLSYGAVLRDIRFGGAPLTLGHDRLQPYVTGTAYIGAVAGRYANRIAGGRFALDGKTYQLGRNEAGRTHLHGGAKGFSACNWTLVSVTPSQAVLELHSPDGDESYPGNLTVRCTYTVEAPATLAVDLQATTDAPTIVNLALHSYFNLGGAPTVIDHELTVPADTFLPVTADKIPTGEFATVDGTAFDFRTPRRIGRGEVDHTLVVARTPSAEPRPLARLSDPTSGIVLELRSTEPGLHFYDGHMLNETKDGFAPYAGLCLEPQHFPNSPNEPDFPPVVLRPGAVYRQRTEYRFARLRGAGQ